MTPTWPPSSAVVELVNDLPDQASELRMRMALAERIAASVPAAEAEAEEDGYDTVATARFVELSQLALKREIERFNGIPQL